MEKPIQRHPASRPSTISAQARRVNQHEQQIGKGLGLTAEIAPHRIQQPFASGLFVFGTRAESIPRHQFPERPAQFLCKREGTGTGLRQARLICLRITAPPACRRSPLSAIRPVTSPAAAGQLSAATPIGRSSTVSDRPTAERRSAACPCPVLAVSTIPLTRLSSTAMTMITLPARTKKLIRLYHTCSRHPAAQADDTEEAPSQRPTLSLEERLVQHQPRQDRQHRANHVEREKSPHCRAAEKTPSRKSHTPAYAPRTT